MLESEHPQSLPAPYSPEMGANAQPLARAGDEPRRLVSDDLYPLVEAMARGDEQALEALYDRTSSRVMGMTLRILGERASAEEAVLDVFSQAWRQASRYDPARGHVLAWLLNLARSRAIDLQRTRASAAARQAPLEPVEALLKDLGPGPDDSLAIRQRETRVRRALEMLPRLHRQAIMAAFFDGMTHTEIAQTLGAPLGTVKTRIRSGLLTLRDALAKEQVSLG